ncbi:hypothetical protein PG991_015378 [Apiospora marii]|uniref:Uncharacterized protein n=1 Tax=Apiospora marii TaxID=335849 RepID=A0ABR1R1L9_9PEZI
MPSKQKQTTTLELTQARFVVNLAVIFETVSYFGEFFGHGTAFWKRLMTYLEYHGPGRDRQRLQNLTEAYSDARLTYLKQQQGQAGPAPPTRLTELADIINDLRERGQKRDLRDWPLLMDGWRDRLEVVLRELQPISAPADHDPKIKQSSSDDGEGLDDDYSSKGDPLFYFDVSGSKGKKRGPSDDTTFGNSPKRPALEVDDGSHQHSNPGDKVKKTGKARRINAMEVQQKEMREEMNQKFDLQARESAASLEALQSQLKAMQDQLQVQQVAPHVPTPVPTTPIPPVPSLDSKGHDLSEMLDYQPRDFIKAMCEELGKLRAVTKSKIHQMDQQGLPDDEKKLAVSDLSWQIGKCIKVAEKGVEELM